MTSDMGERRTVAQTFVRFVYEDGSVKDVGIEKMDDGTIYVKDDHEWIGGTLGFWQAVWDAAQFVNSAEPFTVEEKK